MIFIIRNFWRRERPASTGSEDSEPADVEPANRPRRRRIRRRSGGDPVANIEPEVLPNGNNTLSCTIITVLVLIIIGLFRFLVQVNHEKELVSCQSIVPINETLIRQLESENKHYVRQHNSCINSLQSSEKQINELKIENQKNEKQKLEKNQEETKKKLELAEKKLNLMKLDIKGQESETKKYKNDFEETEKKLQLAEEKIDAFDKDEFEVKKELIELKKQLKDIKNDKNEFKSKYEAAQEELKTLKTDTHPGLKFILWVSKFIYYVLYSESLNRKKALTKILIPLILLEIIFYFDLLGFVFTVFLLPFYYLFCICIIGFIKKNIRGFSVANW